MTKEEALRKFPDQIEFALANYQPHGLNIQSYSNVVIGGLGGSGIGGRITKTWFAPKFPLPVEIVSDYNLPFYANEKTLLILCSYSGNTEETLTMYDEAIAKGLKPLVLTTGGKILDKAKANGLHTLIAEKGFQPRMALCYPLTYLLLIFAELLQEHETLKSELTTIASRIREKAAHYESEAENLLQQLHKHIQHKVIIVTDAALEGVGIRFAQQIQENSKHEAFQHTLPEANHNVIESYYGTVPSVFFFLRSGYNERVEARFDFLTSLLEVEYHKVLNITFDEFDLGSMMALIYRLDSFTLHLADLRHVNAVEVPNIASLKEFLEG